MSARRQDVLARALRASSAADRRWALDELGRAAAVGDANFAAALAAFVEERRQYLREFPKAARRRGAMGTPPAAAGSLADEWSGATLRARRRALGATRGTCAAACGVGAGTWARWELRHAPPATKLRAIARVLSCGIEDLYSAGEGSRPTTGPAAARAAPLLAAIEPLPPATLRAARRHAGLSVRDVARLAGISAARARAAERSRSADPEDVAAVLEVLDVGEVARLPAEGRRRTRGRVQVQGGALRAARRARRLTLAEVALRAGVDVADVVALEEHRGRRRGRGRALSRVLEALGLPGQAPRFLIVDPS